MARLTESAEVLVRIRRKAYQNAIHFGTYGKPASFTSGRIVTNFQEHCDARLSQLRTGL
jgi:hypothetical protein